MLPQMNVGVIDPDISVVHLSGRLGIGSSGQSIEWKLQSLVAEGARKLVFDLTELTNIDSMGVGVLITIAGRLKHVGGEAKLAAAQGLVARTFDIVQIERVLPRYPTVEAACAAFNSWSGAAGA